MKDPQAAYRFWVQSADKDWKSALRFFSVNEYPWSLFLGHLVLEKLFKAYYAKFIDPQVPFRHSLVLLAKECGLSLSEEDIDFLDAVSAFNIAARYPDARFQFRKRCTKAFARKFLTSIDRFAKRVKKLIRYGKRNH